MDRLNGNQIFDFSAFDEYLRQGEDDSAQRAANWQIAIGLQAEDELRTSDYLLRTACRHIEAEIGIGEAGRLLRSYRESKTQRTPDDDMRDEPQYR